MPTHDAELIEQSELEPAVLFAACKKLGLSEPKKIIMEIGGGQKVDMFGVAVEEATTYLKAYVSLGHPDGPQKHKLKADILKLTFVSKLRPGKSIFVVTSRNVEEWLTRGWLGAALKQFDITVLCVALDAEQRAYLEAGMRRQRDEEGGRE